MLVQLQYLRAIAALMVVYFHAILQLRNVQPDALLTGTLFGKSGVDLFFVLSGFVMWITTADRAIGAREFYTRRIIRIVPLYWALSLLAAAVALIVPSILKSTVFDLPHVIATLLFLPWVNPADPAGTMIAPVIVPGWTLNYEMYFYLLFGALLGLSKAVRPYALAGLLLVIFLLCKLLPQDVTAARFYGDSVIFEFVLGVLIGKVYLDGRRLGGAVAWSVIAAAGALMVYNDWMEWDVPRLFSVGLPAAVVVAGVALLDFSRKPVIGWLNHLGDASFSLYLSHIFVLAGARMIYAKLPFEWMRNEVLFVVLCLVASSVAAVVLHNLFEKPVDRFLRNRRRPPGASFIGKAGLMLSIRSLLAALFAALAVAQPSLAAGVCFKGINLSGAEYGDRNGVENTNFTYPSEKTVAYFAGKGMNIVRLPFSWDRLQPTLNSPLSATELDRLKAAVQRLRDHGMTVLLDPHAFGYYDKARLGTPEVPAFAFADLWIRLAAEFANEPDVLFGLMNEPYDISASEWLGMANDAIAGIRSVGARNLVLVPGTRWSGAHGWRADYPGGSNAEVMRGVKDPIDNYAYEFHQYMDADSSGTKGGCEAAEAANAALVDVTAWLRETGKKGFLGEFGGSQDKACLAGLKAMTATLDDNADAWLGFSYWAAGEWWSETEINNVQPTKKGDRKQLSALPLTPGKQRDTAACATVPPA